MSGFNPGVIDLNGEQKRYVDWVRQFANEGNAAGMRKLMRRVIRSNPSARFDPARVRVHTQRIVGLNAAQSEWVENLFAKLLGDNEVAKAIHNRNSLISLRDGFHHARSLKIAGQIESMQVGPNSVILAEVNPDASRGEIEAMANSLQAAFGAAVIVKPKDVDLSRLSVADLVKFRNRLNQLIPEGGGRQP